MSDGQTIFVVDDDEVLRHSLRWLLESLRHNVQTYASAREFLSVYDPVQPGCLLLDVRMPDISGLQLQEILEKRQIRLPVILITGHGDISMAVRAMKAGAFDFIEKPFNDQVLLERVQQGLALDTRQRCEAAEREKTIERLSSLTPREGEVLEGVVSGKSNKLIAAELEISIKTVEAHRARVMEKMAVNSVAELTALCVVSGHAKGKP
jgi:two-component system, LuxR family, response regulator FixJ